MEAVRAHDMHVSARWCSCWASGRYFSIDLMMTPTSIAPLISGSFRKARGGRRAAPSKCYALIAALFDVRRAARDVERMADAAAVAITAAHKPGTDSFRRGFLQYRHGRQNYDAERARHYFRARQYFHFRHGGQDDAEAMPMPPADAARYFECKYAGRISSCFAGEIFREHAFRLLGDVRSAGHRRTLRPVDGERMRVSRRAARDRAPR